MAQKEEATLLIKIKQTGSKGLKVVGKGLKNIAKTAVAAAGALTAVGIKFFQFARDAQKFDEVRLSFGKLAASQGKDAEKMLQSMRDLSKGTIADMELMKQANQALLLGLPVDRFSDMVNIARSASKATGQSMQFMLESITTGLGRGSKLMLDNLGIVFKLEDAYDEYAKSLGKTAAELTEAEKKQAFINKALEVGLENSKKVSDDSLTLADRYERLRAKANNLSISLGKALGPAFQFVLEQGEKLFNNIELWVESSSAVDFFKFMTKGLLFVKEGFIGLGETIGTLGGAIALALEGVFTLSFDKIKESVALAKEQMTEDLAETGENITSGFARIDQLFAEKDAKDAKRRQNELKAIKKQNVEKKKEEEGFTQFKELQESRKVKGTRDFLQLSASLARSSNSTLAAIGKAAALTQIAIATPQAVASSFAFGTRIGGPPLGFVFGGIAAAAMAAQAAQVAGVQLAEGGIVPSTPGGIAATIGEGGRDEAVIPLPDDFDPDEPGGAAGGSNVTIVVNGGLLGDAQSARELAVALDRELLELRRSNESVSFEDVI